MISRFLIPEVRRRICVQMFAMLAVCALISSAALAQGPPSEIGFDQNLGEIVPQDLKFTDEDGNEVPLSSYFGGKPVILMPVYYKCPMLCGLELNGLVRCLRALDMTIDMKAEKDFEIVTFSIDPKETSELASRKRKQYLAQYDSPGSEDGWHFLTGDQESIDALCRTIGFRTKYDEITGQYAHASGIVVCTPDGMVSRYLYGVEFAPKDLRLAVVESSQGKVGSFAEHVMLFCFKYDPREGKYGVAVLNLLRASGVITVLILACSVGWMLKRDRNSMSVSAPLEGAHHE
ncbi:SCO family protein [Planctomicrobium sp. SH661]|uniref:SCO family protein n=1 Tax=Planctomicrobium sp. SH661 TaxID=3448124 RepID=UPI003F5B4DD6